jgi:hypothetical protein
MRPMKYARLVALVSILVGAGCSSPSDPARGPGGQGGDGEGGAGGRTSPDSGAAGKGGIGGAGTPDAGPAPDGATGVTDAAAAADLAVPRDAAVPVDGEEEPPDTGVRLPACAKPDIDHLEMWRAHGGSLRPAVGGNLLVKEGDAYYMKVEFLPGSAWHEIVVPVANALAKKADLSASKGFTIIYSATADLWVQLRPLTHPHGGEQHTFKLPATNGQLDVLFVPFTAASWGMLLGAPKFPFSEALKEANFFDFVGPPDEANTFIVRALRFDGYVPSCT